MRTVTQHKLQLISLNQSTHNTLFYVHLSKIGNVSSINGKKTIYYRSSINVGNDNLIKSDKLQIIKEVVIGVRLLGAEISRKVVISIGKGVLKDNDRNTLSEFSGHITLTDNWGRAILQSMGWVIRKWTTGKIEPSPQFLAEERFTFQKPIATVVYDHNIPRGLSINLDQTPNVSPGNYTFNLKEAKNIPVKGANDKRQIAATFFVSATGNSLPIQVIYAGKPKNICQIFNFHVVFTSQIPKTTDQMN